jgi:hypothetical protein
VAKTPWGKKMSIEAMKKALAKFESLWEIGIDAEYKVELLPEIRMLRQAIEQAEKQEPVAWLVRDYVDGFRYVSSTENPSGTIAGLSEPLYTAPPRKEWVWLTDDEIKNILDCGREGLIDIKKAEQILKDKNT